MSNQPFSIQSAFRPAIQAFKTYWLPITLIQSCALAIVLSYYCIDAASAVFQTISDWKDAGGIFLAAALTVFSGGILPELIKRKFRPAHTPAPTLHELLHQFGMWALIGILVDRFYAFQNILFGSSDSPQILLVKVLCDQLIFTPFISLPFTVLWFRLWETRTQPSHYFSNFGIKTIAQRVLPLWASCLSFWPIMLLLIYSLPQTLQFPLFLMGNAAFSILLIFILRNKQNPSN